MESLGLLPVPRHIYGRGYDELLRTMEVNNRRLEDHTSRLVSASGFWTPGTVYPSSPKTGDLFYDTTLQRLMVWDGSAWVQNGLKFDPPACRVSKSAAQAVPNATLTTCIFDTEQYDTAGLHDNVTNNSRITIPAGAAGIYDIKAHLLFDANTAGVRESMLFVNGSLRIADQSPSMRADGYWPISIASDYKLAVGDYIEVKVYQTSGVSLNLFADSRSLKFSAHWVGRG